MSLFKNVSMTAVLAVDEAWAIGKNNTIPWRSSKDMVFFKNLTSGSVLIMGRKTWESLPNKVLSNRRILVLSSNKALKSEVGRVNRSNKENCTIELLNSIKELSDRCQEMILEEDFYLVGGGSLYRDLFKYCKFAYVTTVKCLIENPDTYFDPTHLSDMIPILKEDIEGCPSISITSYVRVKTHVPA